MGTGSALSGVRIVAVDDDPTTLRLLQRFLEQQGCIISGAMSAQEGLKRVMEDRPQFVLLDISLPDRNGLIVLQEIAQIDPQIRVVIMSGWAHDLLDSEAIKKLGAWHVVAKPLDFQRLGNILSEAVKKPSEGSSRGSEPSFP